MYFDHRRPTYARATVGRTITGCVYSDEISRLQHSYTRITDSAVTYTFSTVGDTIFSTADCRMASVPIIVSRRYIRRGRLYRTIWQAGPAVGKDILYTKWRSFCLQRTDACSSL